MPVARKPERKPVNEAEVLKVIEKGLDVKEEPGNGRERKKTSPEDEKETTIILRIKSGLVKRVDSARGKRQVKTPRNTWLVEAVLEKLSTERA